MQIPFEAASQRRTNEQADDPIRREGKKRVVSSSVLLTLVIVGMIAALAVGYWWYVLGLTTSWGGAITVPLFDDPAISCYGSDTCLAVDSTGSAVMFRGATVTAMSHVPKKQSFGGVGCAPDGQCIVVTDSGQTWSEYGGVWRNRGRLGAYPDSSDVSCPTPTYCATVLTGDSASSYETTISIWNGSRWTASWRSSDSTYAESVSCPSPGVCAASLTVALQKSEIIELRDGHWRLKASFANIPETAVMSCPTTTYCLVPTDIGPLIRLTNGNWSLWWRTLPNGQQVHLPVGERAVCWAQAQCAIGFESGKVVRIDGSTMETPQFVDPNLGDLGCTSQGFCIEVGTNGYAYRHRFAP